MMEKHKDNKKRIAAGLTAAVLLTASVFGITSAVRATTARTVPVIPVSDLNYGDYLDWQNSVTGMITTEAEQNVYLSSTEKVQEVMVQEGQAVHKGDVLLRYDTKSTKLALEKEKVKKEKIELDIEVARENIKTLENTTASSDGDGFGFVEDFAEIEAEDILSKADVHEKILTADAKPVSEGSEFEILGTADAPYVFLCKGDSVILSKDFIKKWQKKAEQMEMQQLYIELAALDDAKNLQKAWISDIMLLDPEYDIEVDLRSGKAGYAAMNDPEQMAVLLRKILLDVPEDERGAWLTAMLDKLMILTEKEEKTDQRGELLAAMLNELGKEEQADFAAEFAAAASLLDEKTLSVMFRSLAQNLTGEQVEGIDREAVNEMLVLLLDNLNEEQVKAIDPQVLTPFLQQLSKEQIQEIDPGVLSAMMAGMSSEQVEALDPEAMGAVLSGLSEDQVSKLDPASLRHFFGLLSADQLKILLEERGDEIKEILNQMQEPAEQEQTPSGNKDRTNSETGEGAGNNDGSSNSSEGKTSAVNEGNTGSGETVTPPEDSGDDAEEGTAAGPGSTEGSGSGTGSDNGEDPQKETEPETNQDPQNGAGTGTGEDSENEETGETIEGSESGREDAEQQDVQSGPEETQDQPEQEAPAEEEAEPVSPESEQESSPAEDTTPSTASDTSKGDSGSRILSPDTSYTSDELAKARREAKEKLRDLELNLRESDLKIGKAEQALEQGVVTANMNGVVKRAGDPNSPPTDGSAFITVAGSDGLFVKSGIKETKLGTLKEGDLVKITSWQTGGQYEAEIKSISPYPDSTGMFDGSGTETYFPFTANIIDRDAVLQNGEWVEVSYNSAEGGSGGSMTVMKAFVREEGSKKYVYIRDDNNRLRKQYIVTGTLSDSGYEVLDGLAESDWIAFPYGKNVKEGAKTRESTPAELLR